MYAILRKNIFRRVMKSTKILAVLGIVFGIIGLIMGVISIFMRS